MYDTSNDEQSLDNIYPAEIKTGKNGQKISNNLNNSSQGNIKGYTSIRINMRESTNKIRQTKQTPNPTNNQHSYSNRTIIKQRHIRMMFKS